jgi:hypothetical protein
MSEREIGAATHRHNLPSPPHRSQLVKRVRDMALLWALFGALCGACPHLASGGNIIGILSSAIAGVIVTPVLGVLIALLGGQLKPTLLGGIWGAMIGVLAGFVGGAANAPLTADFGLLVGGMAGGTFPQVLRSTAFLARSVMAVGRGR